MCKTADKVNVLDQDPPTKTQWGYQHRGNVDNSLNLKPTLGDALSYGFVDENTCACHFCSWRQGKKLTFTKQIGARYVLLSSSARIRSVRDFHFSRRGVVTRPQLSYFIRKDPTVPKIFGRRTIVYQKRWQKL